MTDRVAQAWFDYRQAERRLERCIMLNDPTATTIARRQAQVTFDFWLLATNADEPHAVPASPSAAGAPSAS